MTISVGDQVQYSAKFLQSIHTFTGPLPFAIGKVTGITDLGGISIASITWENTDECPPRVNVNNLIQKGRLEPD